MYYLTQLLKRKEDNENVMLLSFLMLQNQKTGEVTTVIETIDKDLNVVEIKNLHGGYKPVEPHKVLDAHIGFLGGIDTEKFIEYFGENKIKEFIENKGGK